MKVFIFDDQTDGRIQQLVERAQVEIVSTHSLYGETLPVERSLFDGKAFESLAPVDMLILEITEGNPDVNYLLAQAVLQQKPTLCLYKKNREPRDLLNYLIKRGTPKCITTHAYSENSLANFVDRFLAATTLLPGHMEDTPSIKFTLRLTPQVDRYLEYKSKKVNRTKADLLRDWLRLRMDEDEEFYTKRDKVI
ncbi:MAG: hypothetical protein AAB558_04600 [Patescibacteria group bacterium]